MGHLKLTRDQRGELISALVEARKTNAKDSYKINAILLLSDEWTIQQVTEALFLSDETIRTYLKDYKKGGIKRLLKTGYNGSKCKLNRHQRRKLCKELDSNIYLTTNQIIEYVEREFGISYSTSGMKDLLHRLGYVYKKPKLVPGKADEELQEEFVKQYEKIMKTKPDNAAVYFADGVHPEHNTLAAYGWLKKGEERKLKTNSGRQRVNLHGAINIETLDVEIVESKRVNGSSTIELLKKIDKSCSLASIIYVILDNARYHYSKEVQEYLKNTKIKLVFLPTYSPNLNLIERLWMLFKKKILYNKYYEKFKDFKTACLGFFANISQYNNELQTLMNEEFHIL